MTLILMGILLVAGLIAVILGFIYNDAPCCKHEWQGVGSSRISKYNGSAGKDSFIRYTLVCTKCGKSKYIDL
jgi:hypothetical protein